MGSPMAQTKAQASSIRYERMQSNPKFKELIDKKKKFILPLTVFFLLFYFGLPLLAAYTKILHQPAVGDISWIWIYSFAQFIMTWTLVTLYMKKASTFDALAKEVLEEEEAGGNRR
ncbi:MAG TPA: DUF485 domain-containing protein [Bacillaceae bacterium]